MTDHEGRVDAKWGRVRRAKSYEIQACPDPITPANWQGRPSVTKTTAALDGFVSGTKIWVRVRAVSAGGQGPWSDPATKVIP